MKTAVLCLSTFLLLGEAGAQRQMENLTRGLVVVPMEDGKQFVSCRLFGTDPESIAFNLYRRGATNVAERVNEIPISDATNFVVRNGDKADGVSYTENRR